MSHPPLQPGRDHAITAGAAAEMTRRHRTGLAAETPDATASGAIGGLRDVLAGTRPPEEGTLGGLFSKKSILALLSRADAEFLRYYHARDKDGKRTIVLVAADAKGNDLLDGGTQTLDHHWPCPPYCPPEASALRG